MIMDIQTTCSALKAESDMKKHGCAPLQESHGTLLHAGCPWQVVSMKKRIEIDSLQFYSVNELRSSSFPGMNQISSVKDILDTVSLNERRT